MRLVLIGGGEIGKGTTSYETEHIDKEIVKMTNKNNPVFLFIGFASSYSDSYYDVIKKIYSNLGCKTTYLRKKNIINNRELSLKKLDEADIIYIGGGDTVKLLDTLKEYNLEKEIKKQVSNNKVIAGISAGAILLSKEGYSDTYILRGESDKYCFIKGYNYFKYSITPHFNNELREEELKKDIQNTSKEVYCLEDNSALIIEDNSIRTITNNTNVYKVTYKNRYIKKEIK